LSRRFEVLCTVVELTKPLIDCLRHALAKDVYALALQKERKERKKKRKKEMKEKEKNALEIGRRGLTLKVVVDVVVADDATE
jgi:hypothetical protein